VVVVPHDTPGLGRMQRRPRSPSLVRCFHPAALLLRGCGGSAGPDGQTL